MVGVDSLALEKHLNLLGLISRRFVHLLIRRKSDATKHLQGKEDLIDTVWKRCAILYIMVKKSQKARSAISSMRVSLQKNKWTTFLDKLSSSSPEDQNTLHMMLFLTLLRESILNEKGCRPFWTPAFKELSEKLLSPIGTECVDLDLTSSTIWSQRQVVKLPSLTIKETKAQNKNLPKTSCLLFTSTVADKWVKEVTQGEKERTKSMLLKIRLNKNQKKIIDEWINTSNYVYNKTVEELNVDSKQGFIKLRDKLVTNMTKKNDPEYSSISDQIMQLHRQKKEIVKERAIEQKKIDNLDQNNPNYESLLQQYEVTIANCKTRIEALQHDIQEMNAHLRNQAKTMDSVKNTTLREWELHTPKEIRASAVKDAVTAFKSCFTNFRNGNIKYFNVGFRKHDESHKYVNIYKPFIKIVNNCFEMTTMGFGEDNKFLIGRRQCARFKKRNQSLQIQHDCKIVKIFNEYWVVVPYKVKTKETKTHPETFGGIDPGCRTFMTVMTDNGYKEYQHDSGTLKKLNNKIKLMKARRIGKQKDKRIRKKQIHKHEQKKLNIINNVHWQTIHDIVDQNDVTIYGNIKSHDIVKGGNNRTLNQMFNDMRFYVFKQRLLFKASLNGKLVVPINESYTTKTCSNCGNMYEINSSKTYCCSHCGMVADRDYNSAKNILMKGVLLN